MSALVVECDQCEAVRTVAVKSGDTVPWLTHPDHEPTQTRPWDVRTYFTIPIDEPMFQSVEDRWRREMGRALVDHEARAFGFRFPYRPRKPKHGRHWSAPALRKNGKPKKKSQRWYGVLRPSDD